MTSLYRPDYWITRLGLEPHPEGGFFKETYRSGEKVPAQALPDRFDGDRNFSTAIYFLLTSGDISHFHKIKSDELWHFYSGSSLTIFSLDSNGLTTHVLGSPDIKGTSLQVVIPANTWFGALVNEPDSYVLAGCTVSPGFDFKDFEMAERAVLLKAFPDHKLIIERLTKP